MVAQPRPEQQQGRCRVTWDRSWLCSSGGVGCVPPGWALGWESGQSRRLQGPGMGWQDPGAQAGLMCLSQTPTAAWGQPRIAVTTAKDCWE